MDAPKDEKAGGKKKPKLLLILAGGLILGGGGFAAYLFLAGGGSGAEAAAPAHGKPDAHGGGHGGGHGDAHGDGHGKKEEGKVLAAGSEKKGKSKIITREPAVVNLKSSGGTRYLKVRIGLEITSDAVSEEIKNLDPQLSDFISEKLATTDIEQIDNAAGRNRLKRELLNGINEILEAGVVEKIYFTEFLIQ
jgi:flagellar protein FliL